MNIAILDDYQNTTRSLNCFDKLKAHQVTVWNDHTKDIDVLAERLKHTEALVLIRERTPIPAALVSRLPRLKLVSLRGVYPHVDIKACAARGITVCSSSPPDRPSYATAEFTWGLILAALRHIPQEVAALKEGRWQSTMGSGLRGRTLGVFSYGRIGRLVAGYGRAFGMRTLVWGREGALVKAAMDGHNVAQNKQQFFATADIVTLHLRLLPQTRGIVTAADLALMQSTALFVNTSRAELVEKGALENALHNGHPGMAAVDVYEEEPVLGGNHPLLKLPNVLCTPHLGYVERDALEDQFTDMFDQILAYAAGSPINVINSPVSGR